MIMSLVICILNFRQFYVGCDHRDEGVLRFNDVGMLDSGFLHWYLHSWIDLLVRTLLLERLFLMHCQLLERLLRGILR